MVSLLCGEGGKVDTAEPHTALSFQAILLDFYALPQVRETLETQTWAPIFKLLSCTTLAKRLSAVIDGTSFYFKCLYYFNTETFCTQIYFVLIN